MEAAITLPAGPSAGLFAELGGAIFRRALRILGDEAAAARCAETLFVRFVVYADAAQTDEGARWSWIYRVVTSVSLRQLGDAARPGATAARPGGVAGAAGMADMRTLRRLDEATQSILVLSALDGLTPEEIGAVLGVDPALARRRIDTAAAAHMIGDQGGAPGEHPSLLAVDRDRAAHADHLASCAACRGIAGEGDRLSDHFARALAPAAVPRVAAAVRTERARRAADTGPRWKRILWLGGGFVVVSVLALVVARPRSPDRAEVPYAGVKGASQSKAAGIQIAVGRGTEIRALEPATALQVGDRLFFRVKADRPRFLELRVRSGAGERRIFPMAGPEAGVVKPGQSLDAAYVVEEPSAAVAPSPAPGGGSSGASSSDRHLWIIGRFADHPFAVDLPPGADVEVVPVRAEIQ